MNTLRWYLLIPAAIAAWYAVFVVGIFTYSFIENYLCPPQESVSGSCTNPAVELYLKIIVHAFVALSAIAVMSSTFLVAPEQKQEVARLTLVVGIVIAAYAGAMTHEWTLFICAAAGGLAALAIPFRDRF